MGNHLTLGITKIGDLLLKNRITDTDEQGVLEGITLTVPEYQRPYKWTAKNANQLLDDIEEAMYGNKEVYRVGTLILYHDAGKNEYDIVDGQQRVITFALLLYCLGADSFPFLNQSLTDNQYTTHNVKNNQRALMGRISKLLADDKEKGNLLEYIKNRCELVVVITDDKSEAFQFFDSQNARGKALYPHDLLKAYHLREMTGIDAGETERIVRTWEEMNQRQLAALFNEYLYRLKEWVRGNQPGLLSEQNIDIFKGITSRDNYPYAQYYKGAFAYADEMNRSNVPFVTGIQHVNPFQIDAPIIAGKPFFKYEGYYINDNPIVKTLDKYDFRNGTGNRITRLLFDTAILLYVDRFCPAVPSKADTEYLEQFVVFAFVWAYSMRAQYRSVSWRVAQNYVQGVSDRRNAFNIYKIISESASPGLLLSRMADRLEPIRRTSVNEGIIKEMDKEPDKSRLMEAEPDKDIVFDHYINYFRANRFWEDK